ncbi:TPA: hypothetical protein ACGIK9_002873 [Acinetobacter baumannii]|uniref:hypothetical protein n=1 Tax=Acinetobacter baumannii TaxID=470 RepID=UPI00338DF4FD
MLKKLTIALGAAVCLTTFTGAFKVEELSLNTAQTDNVRIIQPDLADEVSKHYLSTDIKDTYLNYRDLETKHIFDRLPNNYKLNINAFMHESALRKALAPDFEPTKISLLEIIETNYPNTENVQTNEDYLTLLRSMYQEVFNHYFNLSLDEKNGEKVKAYFLNSSKFKIRSIKGNIRILDKDTGIVVADKNFNQVFALPIAPNRQIGFHETIAIDNPKYANIASNDLVYQANVLEVTFTNGQYLNLDQLYRKQVEKQVRQPY